MDIAESRDFGATACNQATALRVPPIRLLEEHEILSRTQACERIGIDPDKPAALIQLGSGSNRDIVSIIDSVFSRLSNHPDIQPVLAEWMIAPKSLDLWPGVRRLRGFPLSRYFNAFDFTISAAGYNSFNEIISFALPAIFMANSHATMDDQDGRAAFAQDNEAAFHIPDLEAHRVGPLIDRILDPELQSIMRYNCSRLALDNGAAKAAEAIRQIC
jgi:UDP:flavonoid glycosyltransferase YjiC (YdhE family)